MQQMLVRVRQAAYASEQVSHVACSSHQGTTSRGGVARGCGAPANEGTAFYYSTFTKRTVRRYSGTPSVALTVRFTAAFGLFFRIIHEALPW